MVTIVSSKNSHTYSHRKKEQLWKICDNLADKNGFRRNVYWVSGEFYRGYWRHNRREGVGIHIYRNGNRYEGEWKNGRREGQGIFWIVDGGKYRSVYRGSWKNGLWHGQGLLYGDYGEMYEGFFKNGKRCGVGKQTYWCPLSKSFHVYIGEWLDDKREGIGTLKMCKLAYSEFGIPPFLYHFPLFIPFSFPEKINYGKSCMNSFNSLHLALF
eukprot:c3679_g1_i1 orf=251-886(-)